MVIGSISETQRNYKCSREAWYLYPPQFDPVVALPSRFPSNPSPSRCSDSSLKSTAFVPNRTTGVHSVLYNPIGRLRRPLFVPETKLIGNVRLSGWEGLRL